MNGTDILSIRKMPLGVQGFEGLINDGYIYVDKTKYIYNLAHNGKQYFLSRPRRFGKSLLLSTMDAYWKGKKELFKGLAIEKLEGDNENSWQTYPVFYFDFNGKNYQKDIKNKRYLIHQDDKEKSDSNSSKHDSKNNNIVGKLEEKLDDILGDYEKIYGDEYKTKSLEKRFEQLLRMAHEQTGKRCVVLVDEYDKPLLEIMEDEDLVKYNKTVFKSFFSVLKSSDADVKFVFITGVTKFSKVSIFSDLNQLTDISLYDEFSGICGITQEELNNNFKPEIESLCARRKLTIDECLEKLKKKYDGYHFSEEREAVYNPYSLLSAFFKKSFGSFWFETGTPTFLVKKLRQINYDVQQFSNESLCATEERISDYRVEERQNGEIENEDVIPLLYQTGYLTIVDYNEDESYYTLGFPNEEVKYAFLSSLLPEYAPAVNKVSGKDIISIRKYLGAGKLDSVRDAFIALYASITYTSNETTYEHYFQMVIYLVFELLNQYVHVEVHSALGRADCIVETEKYVYIFEFKRDDSADNALKQIDDNGYDKPYVVDKRKIYKIGVDFDSASKNISEWKVKA